MSAIVAAGGELYAQGPHCGSEMSCITEVNAPKDAITLGHTVLFDSSTPLELLVEHEYQHVVDIESVGGFPFYFSYLRESAIRWVTGWGDPYLHLRWERRALNAEQGTRPSTAKWWLPWVLP